MILALEFTDDNLMRLLFVFWLPAYIFHLVAFMIANHDDIFFDWKRFALGDIASWGIICGITVLLVQFLDSPRWILYLVYGIHTLIISTIFTDASLYQETISAANIWKIFMETIIESILIPWAAGVGAGVISVLIFGL